MRHILIEYFVTQQLLCCKFVYIFIKLQILYVIYMYLYISDIVNQQPQAKQQLKKKNKFEKLVCCRYRFQLEVLSLPLRFTSS